MRIWLLVLTVSWLVVPNVLWAQDTGAVIAPGLWGAWGGSHHASTAEEGMARGMADLTRSAGMANLLNSEAAINMQTAARKNMENRVFGTEAYFDRRRINREAREADRRPQASPDDLARFAQARAPSRLSASELDPFTGQIVWPSILQQEIYAEYREALESLFAERAISGHLDMQQQADIRQLTQEMQQTLKSRIRDYPPQQYMQTRTFIEGLRTELLASTT
jgi:hypothetical protein